jgi:hypothetical protein
LRKRKEKMDEMELLASSFEKNLGKAVLELFSPDPGDKMFAYRKFMSSTVTFTICGQKIGGFNDHLLEQFYMTDYPLTRPKYFDFFSGHDLAKLESALGVRIIVSMKGADKFNRWYKIHDYRIYDQLRTPRPVGAWLVLVAFGNNEWRLYKLDRELESLRKGFLYNPTRSEELFRMDGRIETCDICLLDSLDRLLPPDSGKPPFLPHVHGPDCKTIISLISLKADDTFYSDYMRGREFVLASHLQTAPQARTLDMSAPKKNMFGILGVFLKDPDSVQDYQLKDLPVICITGDLRLYRLRKKYADFVLAMEERVRNPKRESLPNEAAYLGVGGDKKLLKKKLACNCQIDEASKKSASGGIEGNEEEEEEEEEDNDCNDDDDDEEEEERITERYREMLRVTEGERCIPPAAATPKSSRPGPCPCSLCKGATRYECNMSANGPQKLYTTELPLKDLLKMTGRWNRTAESILARCSRLSTASFDIESAAKPVDGGAGNEDIAFPEKTVSNLRLPRVVYAVHVPVLLGFIDNLMLERGLEPVILKNDIIERNSLERAFLEEIVKRRKEAVQVKRNLLGYLFAWLSRYKRAHFSFYASIGLIKEGQVSQLSLISGYDDDDDENESVARKKEDIIILSSSASLGENKGIRSKRAEIALKEALTEKTNALQDAWHHSLFGLIEKRLRRLMASYTVYGFNAESFDLVLMAAGLTTYAKEIGCRRISMNRQGGKINCLMIDGIRIAEIKKLVAPGTSLEKLAKTCGLKESKAMFPFDKFTSPDYLLEKKLPESCQDWKSSLNPKAPSQADVDKALELFTSRGFKTVGDYLKYYLKLDVIILQKCILSLLAKYYEKQGIDFVECCKFTVSSLSSMSAQLYLARHKRIGMFFVNHRRIYSVS